MLGNGKEERTCKRCYKTQTRNATSSSVNTLRPTSSGTMITLTPKPTTTQNKIKVTPKVSMRPTATPKATGKVTPKPMTTFKSVLCKHTNKKIISQDRMGNTILITHQCNACGQTFTTNVKINIPNQSITNMIKKIGK